MNAIRSTDHKCLVELHNAVASNHALHLLQHLNFAVRNVCSKDPECDIRVIFKSPSKPDNCKTTVAELVYNLELVLDYIA